MLYREKIRIDRKEYKTPDIYNNIKDDNKQFAKESSPVHPRRRVKVKGKKIGTKKRTKEEKSIPDRI